jgi:hypothetical protein
VSQKKPAAPPLAELPQIPIRRAITEGLGVSVQHGYKLVHDKTLKTHNIGRRRFTTWADLQACVATLRKRAKSDPGLPERPAA